MIKSTVSISTRTLLEYPRAKSWLRSSECFAILRSPLRNGYSYLCENIYEHLICWARDVLSTSSSTSQCASCNFVATYSYARWRNWLYTLQKVEHCGREIIKETIIEFLSHPSRCLAYNFEIRNDDTCLQISHFF